MAKLAPITMAGLSPERKEMYRKAAARPSREIYIELKLHNQKTSIAAYNAGQQYRLNFKLNGANIPMRYRTASINDEKPYISGTNDQSKLWHVAQQYIQKFNNGKGIGLMLHGGIGTGKTHLVCAIGNDLLKEDKTVAYTTIKEVVAGVQNSWKGDGELDFYNALTQPDLLILDEIGVQKDSDFERTVISTITDKRSRECKSTIAISNLPPEKISKMMGKRAYDRITAGGKYLFSLNGSSLRSVFG